jgi:cyclopropane-fatty-acyl-phospholipid synthase
VSAGGHAAAARGGTAAVWPDRLARRLLLGKLAGLQHGRLHIRDGGQSYLFGQADAPAGLRASLDVHRPRFYRRAAFDGSVGAGESYFQGDWDCDDLTALTRILLRNRAVLERMDGGLGRLHAPLHRLYHWCRRNTPAGSRRNIAAHYDLGNELFARFLDETMMYSCAIFERPGAGLYQASVAKLESVCRKLDLCPEDHVIEIGSGWGGFAVHAAGRYGCRVTTTTISREQYDYARRRVREAGLAERVTVLNRDYRELEGQYDKLVSIEMIEAVGHEHYPAFFRQCGELLKPDGMGLIQAITIADQRYREARDQVDFIKRYIFPGGCLPSVSVMTGCLTRYTDLRLLHLEDIGPHYAETLRHWRERFFSNIEDIAALGYDEVFQRLWEFYLCYCEGAFRERAIGDVQLLAVKPDCRRPSLPCAVLQDV